MYYKYYVPDMSQILTSNVNSFLLVSPDNFDGRNDKRREKKCGRIRDEIFPFPLGAYMTHSIVPRCSTVNETADEATSVILWYDREHSTITFFLYPGCDGTAIFSLRRSCEGQGREKAVMWEINGVVTFNVTWWVFNSYGSRGEKLLRESS